MDCGCGFFGRPDSLYMKDVLAYDQSLIAPLLGTSTVHVISLQRTTEVCDNAIIGRCNKN